MINLKQILVPTDFSEHSKNALRYAAAFAEKFGARIHLLHVFQNLAIFQPEAVTAGAARAGRPMMPPIDEMLAAARAALDHALAECPIKGVPIHPDVREGSPAEEILVFAKEKDVDLIVMGTHGRGWLAHVLLGSVS